MKDNPLLKVRKRQEHEGGEWDLELRGDPNQLNEGLKLLMRKNQDSFELIRKAIEEVEFNEPSVDFNKDRTHFAINLIEFKGPKNGIDVTKTLLGSRKDLTILLTQALMQDDDLLDITKQAVGICMEMDNPFISMLRRLAREGDNED